MDISCPSTCLTPASCPPGTSSTGSCCSHTPLQFPKEGEGFKMKFLDQLLRGGGTPPTHDGKVQGLPSKMQVWEQLWGCGISCFGGGMADGDGGRVLPERGAPACKSREEEGGRSGGSCSLPLYCRLPNFGVQGDEDTPPVLLRH